MSASRARTPQARRRYRPDQRRQIHGQGTRTTVARLEDAPAQSRGRDRGDGSVCRADNLVSPALWIADHGARPATYSVVWRHSASNRGMDRKLDLGSMRLGTSSPLSDPRPGSGLWRGLHPKTSDQWAFAIYRRRRAPLGKMAMLEG